MNSTPEITGGLLTSKPTWSNTCEVFDHVGFFCALLRQACRRACWLGVGSVQSTASKGPRARWANRYWEASRVLILSGKAAGHLSADLSLFQGEPDHVAFGYRVPRDCVDHRPFWLGPYLRLCLGRGEDPLRHLPHSRRAFFRVPRVRTPLLP